MVTTTARPLVVQASFPAPRPTTNPYITMLAGCLDALDDVELRTFTWRRALLGRFDVFHAHWPEVLVSGHGPLKRLVRQALATLLLVKLVAGRIPVVRTVHNLELPTGISRRERALLRWVEHLTTLRIVINTSTELAEGQATEVIVHGHYRDWFAEHPRPASVPGRFGYVGLVRQYKNVAGLVRAFRGLEDRSLSLRVGGRPSTDDLAAELRAVATGDDRIALHLEFLSDRELVEMVAHSRLVVLPYREMHNSGGTLAALSLDRPVLIPDNLVNRRLREEVGPEWVHLYPGELGPDTLTAVMSEVSDHPPAGRPDLEARDWSGCARDHLGAYRRAVRLRRAARA